MTPTRLFAVSFAACLAVFGVGCDVPVDKYPSPRGNAPDLLGVVEGTLLYQGPRPTCVPDILGVPTIKGRVVMTLFAFSNPPPPSGKATGAMALFAIAGRDLFDVDDCMPPEGSTEVIQRTAEFTWPGFAMNADYQIRSFFDMDGDFVPYFSVQRIPTAGDVLGGALAENSQPGYRRISFGPLEDYPLGQVVNGVVVVNVLPTNTEPPIWEWGKRDIDGDGVIDEMPLPMRAEEIVPFNPLPSSGSPWEDVAWEITRTTLHMIDDTREDFLEAFGAADMSYELGGSQYAWHVRADLDRNGDGEANEAHPLLGFAPVSYRFMTPLVILIRARTPEELEGGIPNVQILNLVRHQKFPPQNPQRVRYPDLDILFPPGALVDLMPENPICRVLYLAPGNLSLFFELQPPGEPPIPRDCQELPTGRFTTAVLHGVAGGVPAAAAPEVSQIGVELMGGVFSGQAWAVPNELGAPDLHYNPNAVDQIPPELQLPSQGPDQRMTVYDHDPSNGVRHDCEETPNTGGVMAPFTIPAVDPVCCGPIMHLCGLPLCEITLTESGLAIREATTLNADGELTCVPFEMPLACCDPE